MQTFQYIGRASVPHLRKELAEAGIEPLDIQILSEHLFISFPDEVTREQADTVVLAHNADTIEMQEKNRRDDERRDLAQMDAVLAEMRGDIATLSTPGNMTIAALRPIVLRNTQAMLIGLNFIRRYAERQDIT